MDAKLNVALVQNNAGLDFAANMDFLEKAIVDAADDGADLIATAEYCSHYGMADGHLDVGGAPIEQHEGLMAFQTLAGRIQKHILIGSIGVAATDGRTLNTSILLGPDGTILSRYEKIHLFDVDLEGGESYRESNDIAPGDKAVVAGIETDNAKAMLGLSVCYDVRFPHLYRDLAKAGAQILTVPAAFTAKTGRAHWHTLLRARAIETGCFVLAPSQCGANPEGRLKRYGHALIIAPWGEVLAEAGEEPMSISAQLDLSLVDKARKMVPALQHDRDYAVVGPEDGVTTPAAGMTIHAAE